MADDKEETKLSERDLRAQNRDLRAQLEAEQSARVKMENENGELRDKLETPESPAKEENGKNSVLGAATFMREMLENIADGDLSIEPFSGDHTTNLSVTEFFIQVEETANLKNWSPKMRYLRARKALREPARSAVHNASPKITDLVGLKRFLEKRFGVRDPLVHYIGKLCDVRQGPSETGSDFGNRFSKIRRRLDEACPNKFDDETYYAFLVRSLRSPYSEEVRRASAVQKLSFQEAMRFLRQTDRFSPTRSVASEVNYASTERNNFRRPVGAKKWALRNGVNFTGQRPTRHANVTGRARQIFAVVGTKREWMSADRT